MTLDALGEAIGGGNPDAAAVVVSQGHYDEEALEAILKSDVPYVGLVASRKRGASVRAMLEARGVPRLSALRNPAGLDLGARTAPEVALSILAEIVQAQPSQMTWPHAADAAPARGERSQPQEPQTAVDPVCHMDVDIATARHKADVGGVMYYFCCAQCRENFVADPERYLASRS